MRAFDVQAQDAGQTLRLQGGIGGAVKHLRRVGDNGGHNTHRAKAPMGGGHRLHGLQRGAVVQQRIAPAVHLQVKIAGR